MNLDLSPRAAPADLDHSIEQAVAFLSASQLPGGEFKTYISTDEQPWQFDSSPFTTSFVLYALGFVQTAQARAMIERGVEFLLGQMEPGGVWRYWTKQHPRHFWLPPDLDDTSCISFILTKYGIPLPPNRALLLANRNPQGLFYTWLVLRTDSPHNWRQWRVVLRYLARFPSRTYNALWQSKTMSQDDLDSTVNANVLLYLGQDAETRPVVEYLVEVIRAQREGSSDLWYLHPFCLYYLLSRAYANGVTGLGTIQPEVCGRVLDGMSEAGVFENELVTACAICTLLNFDGAVSRLKNAVTDLQGRQQANGAWRRVPIWGGSKKRSVYGSEEMTTALCLEALARYRARVNGTMRE